MTDDYHVYPLNDLKPHVLDQDVCWCKPIRDEESGAWIHNSMDKREDYENGEKMH